VTLQGATGLQKRLAAIASAQGHRAMMNAMAAETARRAIKKAPYRTRNLQRSIEVASVTSDRAVIEARASYAAAVEKGTRPHIIRPRNVKALRFAATAAGQRLSGSARRGAAVVFARYVNHPGTRAQPYLIPAAEEMLRDAGIPRDSIITRWNGAA
jgi:hypothetical protein